MDHSHTIEFAKRLLEITDGCRRDMHEPDNQGVSAKMTGHMLDNAHGDAPNTHELVVSIEREIDNGHRTECFNLATLIAFARLGAKLVRSGVTVV
jgi:hypothetical protein